MWIQLIAHETANESHTELFDALVSFTALKNKECCYHSDSVNNISPQMLDDEQSQGDMRLAQEEGKRGTRQ